MKTLRTTSKNTYFKTLIQELDAYLTIADGEDHDFYNQYNNIEQIKHCVVVFENNKPLGCGGIKNIMPTATR